MHPILKYGLFTFGAAISSELLYRLYRYLLYERKTNVSEALFTSNESGCCQTYDSKCKNPYCSEVLFNRIVQHIDQAKSIICLAVYIFTSKKLYEAILRAHKRGVVVRIIIEKSMYHSTESKARDLEYAGIPVRSLVAENPHTLMHHKFCVIDVFEGETKFKDNLHPTNGLLMSGSMNWTMSAFCGNWENMFVTSDPEIKKRYKQEFDTMWYKLGQQFND